jgi:F-type H+-transporting ATPase subunit delta
MAELATIARPYADALFKALGGDDAAQLAAQVEAVGAVAGNEQLQRFAGNPKTQPAQVFDLLGSAAGTALSPKVANLLHVLIENGRLNALPEVARQFRALVNRRSGVFDATIESAFPLDDAQVAETVAVLEKRFARKLRAQVLVKPELIGGVRVVVGDEVLDTSVRARLEQMKVALTH